MNFKTASVALSVAALALGACAHGNKTANNSNSRQYQNNSWNNSTNQPGFAVSKPSTKERYLLNTSGSLYSRLGGEQAITNYVNEFVNATSQQGVPGFNTSNPNYNQFKQILIGRLSEQTGGPSFNWNNSYTSTLRSFNMNEAQFHTLVGNMVTTLKKYNVTDNDSAELVVIVAGMKDEFIAE